MATVEYAERALLSKTRKTHPKRSQSGRHASIGNTEPALSAQPVASAVEWSVLPLAREPGRLAVAVLLILVAGAGAVYWFESVAYSIGSSAIVALAALPFLLRTHYRLGGGELEVRTALYRFRRPLAAYRSFEIAGDRAWLCTRPRRELIDNYRGMLVLLGDRADDVRLALVSAGLAERELTPLPRGGDERAQRGRGEGNPMTENQSGAPTDG